jgi:hypothetical protein
LACSDLKLRMGQHHPKRHFSCFLSANLAD